MEDRHVLKFYDYFYYKEHLFLVTELLKENLYDAYKNNVRSMQPKYFTLKRVQSVAKQMLEALEYLHSLHIIHSDLKP